MTKSLAAIAALAGSLAVAIAPAMAHHSYAAFDMTKTVQVQGTITKFEWTNPHAFVYAKAGNQAYEIETTSPSMLSRRGFNRQSLKVGDKVTITINPHRTTVGKGSLVSVKLANGQTLTVGGQRPAG